MHEYSVAVRIAEAVQEEAASRGASSVGEVVLQVGELTLINPEQLAFAYGVVTRDGLLSGSSITVEGVKAELACDACGYSGGVGDGTGGAVHARAPVFSCPGCGGRVRVVRGNECTVRNITMVVEDGPGEDDVKP